MVDRNYEGKKNLEIMDEAVNYNSFILSEIMAVFPNRESKILDFGAGRGVFAKAMREQGYQNIMCLEPDPLFRQDHGDFQLDQRIDHDLSPHGRKDTIPR